MIILMNIHSSRISPAVKNNNNNNFNCDFGSLSSETSITTYSIQYELAVLSST
jgi:hypothetical protein